MDTTTMTETQTPPRNLIRRNIRIAEMNVGVDKRGKPFANLKIDTEAKSGPRSGQTIRIFSQIFGNAYEALKDKLCVGAELKVYGVHQRLRADAGTAGCASYVIYGERRAPLAAAAA